MSSKNTVLVTGANGLLGQSLVRTLKEDYLLYACDLDTELYSKELPAERYMRLNLTKRNDVLRIFGDLRPQILINAAAYTNVDGCEKDRDTCWAANTKSVEIMVEACKQFAPLFIQISTDYVFDGSAGPYSETDETRPLGHYGKSKLSAERIVRAGDLEYIIARTMILFGSGVDIRSNFVTWVIGQLKKNKKIQVVNDQVGNPTHADDLAEGLRRLIRAKEYGLFHIAGADSCIEPGAS